MSTCFFHFISQGCKEIPTKISCSVKPVICSRNLFSFSVFFQHKLCPRDPKSHKITARTEKGYAEQQNRRNAQVLMKANLHTVSKHVETIITPSLGYIICFKRELVGAYISVRQCRNCFTTFLDPMIVSFRGSGKYLQIDNPSFDCSKRAMKWTEQTQ